MYARRISTGVICKDMGNGSQSRGQEDRQKKTHTSFRGCRAGWVQSNQQICQGNEPTKQSAGTPCFPSLAFLCAVSSDSNTSGHVYLSTHLARQSYPLATGSHSQSAGAPRTCGSVPGRPAASQPGGTSPPRASAYVLGTASYSVWKIKFKGNALLLLPPPPAQG